MTSPNLITQSTSLHFLLRDLLAQPGNRHLASTAKPVIEAATVIPVAIAQWIEAFHPELKKKSTLHIVVAGATKSADTVDPERWYQIIPQLLGCPDMTIRATLSGSFVQGDNHDADLFFLPPPAFDLHPGDWLSHGEMGALLKTGIPVGLASRSAHEFEHDQWLLDVYGYKIAGTPFINPFKPQDEHTERHHCHTLWELSNEYIPDMSYTPDPLRIKQENDFQRWKQLLDEHNILPFAEQDISSPLEEESGLSYWALLPDFFTDAESGDSYSASINGSDVTLTPIGFDSLAAMDNQPMPASPKFGFERRLWLASASLKLIAFLEDEYAFNEVFVWEKHKGTITRPPCETLAFDGDGQVVESVYASVTKEADDSDDISNRGRVHWLVNIAILVNEDETYDHYESGWCDTVSESKEVCEAHIKKKFKALMSPEF